MTNRPLPGQIEDIRITQVAARPLRPEGEREIKRSRPVSRVLSRTVIHLGCVSPHTSSDLPESGTGRTMGFLFGLAPSGVYPATPVASCAVRSYRTISPLPAANCLGGIFSAALSVGSRPPGVTWHSALRSPDFPPSRPRTPITENSSTRDSDCPADSRRQGYHETGGLPDQWITAGRFPGPGKSTTIDRSADTATIEKIKHPGANYTKINHFNTHHSR